MTYVAALHKHFASNEKFEVAGRRLAKFAKFNRAIFDMTNDYESRCKSLQDLIRGHIDFMNARDFEENYELAIGLKRSMAEFKKVQKREIFRDKVYLEGLLKQINMKVGFVKNNFPSFFHHFSWLATSVHCILLLKACIQRTQQHWSSLSALRSTIVIMLSTSTFVRSRCVRHICVNRSFKCFQDKYKRNFAELANRLMQSNEVIKDDLRQLSGSLESQLSIAQSKQKEVECLVCQVCQQFFG